MAAVPGGTKKLGVLHLLVIVAPIIVTCVTSAIARVVVFDVTHLWFLEGVGLAVTNGGGGRSR